jgi:hypothetical protein
MVKPFPSTIQEAVSRLAAECSPKRLDLILGCDNYNSIEDHFGLGMYIRNEYGLWRGNSLLLRECGTEHPDSASQVILRALWAHLRDTASSEALERARGVRSAADAVRARALKEREDKLASAWEAITERRCPKCARPCPEFRKTCAFCRHHVGRGT